MQSIQQYNAILPEFPLLSSSLEEKLTVENAVGQVVLTDAGWTPLVNFDFLSDMRSGDTHLFHCTITGECSLVTF